MKETDEQIIERIYTTLRKLRKKLNLTEDDFQEVVLKVVKKKKLRHNSIEALVTVMAKRHIYDKWRKSKRKKNQPNQAARPFSNYLTTTDSGKDSDYYISQKLTNSPSPEQLLIQDEKQKELAEALEKAMKDFSDEEKDMLTAFYIDGEKAVDIQKRLGVENYHTVKNNIFRLRKKLRKKLKSFQEKS